MLLKDLTKAYLSVSTEIRGTQRGIGERLQRDPMGSKRLPLAPMDIVDYAVRRRLTVQPCTIGAEISFLKGMLDYAELGLNAEGVSSSAVVKALPMLKRKRLIGASNKRKEMPTPEQHQKILGYLCTTNTDLRVIEVIDFQYKSARRISETCRLMYGDLEGKTVLVRNMKHPKLATGHTMRLAIPDDAYAIIERQERRTNDPQERIFKVSASAVQSAYRRACDHLGYELHLHDSRRGCLTRILASGKTIGQAMLVSGHVSANMILTTYNGLRAEDYHAG